MLSVFQIFKMLIGVVVFVFVITFFLQLAGMYSGVGGMGKEYDAVNSFDETLMNTYTSGNPGTFSTFGGFETIVYEPPLPEKSGDLPKLKFSSGQKTLSVPAFVIASAGDMDMERICDDYGWFSFCYVVAYPQSMVVLFTAVKNTVQTRGMIKDVVESLPDGMKFGYCDGNTSLLPPGESTKEPFLSFVDSDMRAMEDFYPCELEFPDYYRVVTVGDDEADEAEIVLSPAGPGSWTLADRDSSLRLVNITDVAIFMAGGSDAMANKRELLREELSVAAGIMKERNILAERLVLEHNKEPCSGCPTLYPKACGYTDYDGKVHKGTLYTDFGDELDALIRMIQTRRSDVIMKELSDTAAAYEGLVSGGCE